MADVDGSGYVDDRELQRALSSANHEFSLRTIHLLMFIFANNTCRSRLNYMKQNKSPMCL